MAMLIDDSSSRHHHGRFVVATPPVASASQIAFGSKARRIIPPVVPLPPTSTHNAKAANGGALTARSARHREALRVLPRPRSHSAPRLRKGTKADFPTNEGRQNPDGRVMVSTDDESTVRLLPLLPTSAVVTSQAEPALPRVSNPAAPDGKLSTVNDAGERWRHAGRIIRIATNAGRIPPLRQSVVGDSDLMVAAEDFDDCHRIFTAKAKRQLEVVRRNDSEHESGHFSRLVADVASQRIGMESEAPETDVLNKRFGTTWTPYRTKGAPSIREASGEGIRNRVGPSKQSIRKTEPDGGGHEHRQGHDHGHHACHGHDCDVLFLGQPNARRDGQGSDLNGWRAIRRSFDPHKSHIWKKRALASDAKEIFDTPEIEYRRFAADWMATVGAGITKVVLRHDDDPAADDDGDGIPDEVQEVGEVLWHHHRVLCALFSFYAALHHELHCERHWTGCPLNRPPSSAPFPACVV